MDPRREALFDLFLPLIYPLDYPSDTKECRSDEPNVENILCQGRDEIPCDIKDCEAEANNPNGQRYADYQSQKLPIGFHWPFISKVRFYTGLLQRRK